MERPRSTQQFFADMILRDLEGDVAGEIDARTGGNGKTKVPSRI